MSQCQAPGLELGFERRPEDSRLDSSGARRGIDLQYAIEMRQVDGDRARVVVPYARLDSTYPKLDRLLGEFGFTTMADALSRSLPQEVPAP